MSNDQFSGPRIYGSDSSSIVACERVGLRLVVSPDRILDVLDGSGLAQRV